MSFPFYRKHNSGKNYYIIHSEQDFVELQVVGNRIIEHRINIRTYFDKTMLQDMIQCTPPYFECDKEEIDAILKSK